MNIDINALLSGANMKIYNHEEVLNKVEEYYNANNKEEVEATFVKITTKEYTGFPYPDYILALNANPHKLYDEITFAPNLKNDLSSLKIFESTNYDNENDEEEWRPMCEGWDMTNFIPSNTAYSRSGFVASPIPLDYTWREGMTLDEFNKSIKAAIRASENGNKKIRIRRAQKIKDYVNIAKSFIAISPEKGGDGYLPAYGDSTKKVTNEAKIRVVVEDGVIKDAETGKIVKVQVDHLRNNHFISDAGNLAIREAAQNASLGNQVTYIEVIIKPVVNSPYSNIQTLWKPEMINGKVLISGYDRNSNTKIPTDVVKSNFVISKFPVTEKGVNNNICTSTMPATIYLTPKVYSQVNGDKVTQYVFDDDIAVPEYLRFQNKDESDFTGTTKDIVNNRSINHKRDNLTNVNNYNAQLVGNDVDLNEEKKPYEKKYINDYAGSIARNTKQDVNSNNVNGETTIEDIVDYLEEINNNIEGNNLALIISDYDTTKLRFEIFTDKEKVTRIIDYLSPEAKEGEIWKRGQYIDGKYLPLTYDKNIEPDYSPIAEEPLPINTKVYDGKGKVWTNQNYQILISNQGRIISGGKIVTPMVTNVRYKNIGKHGQAHTAVASTWKYKSLLKVKDAYIKHLKKSGVDLKKEKINLEVHHIDENKQNFHPDNLAWITSRENASFNFGVFGIGLFLYDIKNNTETCIAAITSPDDRTDEIGMERLGNEKEIEKATKMGNMFAFKPWKMGKSELDVNISTEQGDIAFKYKGISKAVANHLRATSHFVGDDMYNILGGDKIPILRIVRFRDTRYLLKYNNPKELAKDVIAYLYIPPVVTLRCGDDTVLTLQNVMEACKKANELGLPYNNIRCEYTKEETQYYWMSNENGNIMTNGTPITEEEAFSKINLGVEKFFGYNNSDSEYDFLDDTPVSKSRQRNALQEIKNLMNRMK